MAQHENTHPVPRRPGATAGANAASKARLVAHRQAEKRKRAEAFLTSYSKGQAPSQLYVDTKKGGLRAAEVRVRPTDYLYDQAGRESLHRYQQIRYYDVSGSDVKYQPTTRHSRAIELPESLPDLRLLDQHNRRLQVRELDRCCPGHMLTLKSSQAEIERAFDQLYVAHDAGRKVNPIFLGKALPPERAHLLFESEESATGVAVVTAPQPVAAAEPATPPVEVAEKVAAAAAAAAQATAESMADRAATIMAETFGKGRAELAAEYESLHPGSSAEGMTKAVLAQAIVRLRLLEE